MDVTSLLPMLKLNLEVITDYMDAEAKAAKDAELLQYLKAAEEYITREGVDLEETPGDNQIVIMYASWLYGRRKADNSYGAMPRMLRWAINNRLFQQDIDRGKIPEVDLPESGTEGGS